MKISPLAGKLAEPGTLVDVSRLVTAYYSEAPDAAVPAQRVAFGTSGHRGSSFNLSFNEAHILAITQAICSYRSRQDIKGPLFLGIDTHALSIPAYATVLEVLAANGIEVAIAEGDEYTPTPVISHAILTYNHGRTVGLADGIVLTPSHNPPQDGGIKYDPPHGGPADTHVTAWIEAKANELLQARLAGVKRVAHERALRSSTTRRRDFLTPYINDLGSVVDLDVVRGAGLNLGVDPMGGAGVHYWRRIADRYGLELTVIDQTIDPTFRFIPADWDGQIRMDPSSPYAMERLTGMRERFDLSFACDTDHDRHAIVTRSAGLLPPNHFLVAAVCHLLQNRERWSQASAVGKTVVCSALIDRIAAKYTRKVYETPVGFRWFGEGLLDGSLAFAGEESAGASFVRLDGSVWTTDKDGFVPCLLAAEITASTGRDPGEIYRTLASEFGEPFYERLESPATPAEKATLARLSAGHVESTQLAGETIQARLTHAPGNDARIGGLKVTTENAWFVARPSGTEAMYRIYAESFLGDAHLRQILAEAQVIVAAALKAAETTAWPVALEPVDSAAVAAWRNEGDPN
jgi:phosphoglucomutase